MHIIWGIRGTTPSQFVTQVPEEFNESGSFEIKVTGLHCNEETVNLSVEQVCEMNVKWGATFDCNKESGYYSYTICQTVGTEVTELAKGKIYLN